MKELYILLMNRLETLRWVDDVATIVVADELESLCETNQIEQVINHFGLWNKQVEFVEQEAPFDLPAVFLEFHEIDWKTQGGGRQDAELIWSLHIVTNTADSNEKNLKYLDLLNAIQMALHGYTDESVGTIDRLSTIPCHDFAELKDTVQTYRCMVIDDSAAKKYITTAVEPVIQVR